MSGTDILFFLFQIFIVGPLVLFVIIAIPALIIFWLVNRSIEKDKKRGIVYTSRSNWNYHDSTKKDLGWEKSFVMLSSSSEIDRIEALNMDEETKTKLIGIEVGSAISKIHNLNEQEKGL